MEVFVLVMALYNPIGDIVDVYTEQGFWDEAGCIMMGERFMESEQYFSPVSGDLNRGYQCVKVNITEVDL